MNLRFWLAVCSFAFFGINASPLRAQLLDKQLMVEDRAKLAADAIKFGDAKRGAIVFYQPYMSCTKCHAAGKEQLGPELTRLGKDATPLHVIESILQPSKVIKKNFETVLVRTNKGKTISGLLVKETPDTLILRDPTVPGKLLTIQKDDIEARRGNAPSIMPEGLVGQLTGRQQFLDVVKYVLEIGQKGPRRALELRPDPSLYAARPLPEYEKNIDHAGMISTLDRKAFDRGSKIYNRLCINCHGTKDRAGSLPTSLRFAEGKFKNGSDPYTMYQTLTKGFGMMVPQMWMVPQQKYDVIHYIRETYLKPHNPSQYFALNESYLERLPRGTTRGPAPRQIDLWAQMDYGPNLINTYEIGRDAKNFAYKGIAVRLDAGPGGVSRGRSWMVFDHDTMRIAAAWTGRGFIDWNGIHFNGRHGIHPRVTGTIHFQNPTGPGWAKPGSDSFEDPRLRGRDGRIYGPLPREWAHYKGMYYHRNKVVISYTVGNAKILEMPGGLESEGNNLFTRTMKIGPRDEDLLLRVADHGKQMALTSHELALPDGKQTYHVFGAPPTPTTATGSAPNQFQGAQQIAISKPQAFVMSSRDYSIVARIKTNKGGTIFCKAPASGPWVPDGKSLFVRGGRLTFDIGWVGQIASKRRVDDGKWHDVAMTYDGKSGEVQLYVDGQPDGARVLRPKLGVKPFPVRLGFTASDFPRGQTFFNGEISNVQFFARKLAAKEFKTPLSSKQLVANWDLTKTEKGKVSDGSGNGHVGTVLRGKAAAPTGGSQLAVTIIGDLPGARWSATKDGKLLLRIPKGPSTLQFTLCQAAVSKREKTEDAVSLAVASVDNIDLATLTKGGPPRWPQVLESQAKLGQDNGPFAVDILSHPANNPWFCRVRLTGFDFYDDGDTAAVCSWDGGVWLVRGLKDPAGKLKWKRIASGLFQPLGLKLIDGKIYVTCRDQITICHDLNGDEEIDYFQSFNNDHQVTDHFHEFAMGLQVDNKGNLYYAKSARHALTALVPHHGTLLRVSPDGLKTEIVANGFRAANGVCINPDGTFIVTDQEGHWNPKNRINWVEEGGFYGNMFGYHDVTDNSDSAMRQPLCWITNAFDRSPAELLWVDSKKWGPLQGSLLNLSYGYGKVYVVPHEKLKGQVQGGMCELPIPRFPTGVMRGRFHPGDGQLYTCGMFAWAGNQHQPGGFYRIRYTGKPVYLPKKLEARKDGVRLEFTGEVDGKSAVNPANYAVKVWSLKRTARYGSKHYDEHALEVTKVRVSADGKSVMLTIPKIAPTWCMEIRYAIKGADGQAIDGRIHNTIHNLQGQK